MQNFKNLLGTIQKPCHELGRAPGVGRKIVCAGRNRLGLVGEGESWGKGFPLATYLGARTSP